METTISIILGIVLGLLAIWILTSIYTPETRQIQAIMLFGKLYTFIANIEGKKLYRDEDTPFHEKWDLIDGEEDRFWGNIYFFPWPFFKLYTYDFTYIKAKRKGEEAPGDTVVWEEEESPEILVSRTAISDHLEFRANYPMISVEFETSDFGTVRIYTENVLEVKNPSLVLFGINNWMNFSSNVLDGAFRGVTAIRTLEELNKVSSGKEKTGFSFNEHVTEFVNGKDDKKMKLGNIGLHLARSVFKDFEPANDQTREMINSFTQKSIAEKLGDAEITQKTKSGKALIIEATAKAKAYAKEQNAFVIWRKKYLVDTGLAKVDAQGNITELVPNADTKIGAEAIKKLSELTGTLVLDSESLHKMFNINQQKKGE